jgi:hypothetical protein
MTPKPTPPQTVAKPAMPTAARRLPVSAQNRAVKPTNSAMDRTTTQLRSEAAIVGIARMVETGSPSPGCLTMSAIVLLYTRKKISSGSPPATGSSSTL